mgnify:CR=1 FL=1
MVITEERFKVIYSEVFEEERNLATQRGYCAQLYHLRISESYREYCDKDFDSNEQRLRELLHCRFSNAFKLLNFAFETRMGEQDINLANKDILW